MSSSWKMATLCPQNSDGSYDWAVKKSTDSSPLPIYIPQHEMKVEHTNVAGSSSGRMANGVMYIDWVRTDVRKFNITYPVMTEDELNYIMNTMYGAEFTFYFKDRGVQGTMSAYCSECNYAFYREGYTVYGNEDESIYVPAMYTDVTINVIEK